MKKNDALFFFLNAQRMLSYRWKNNIVYFSGVAKALQMCKPQDHKQTEKCQQFVTVPKKGAAGTDPNPTIKEIKKKTDYCGFCDIL